jgi:hypothetical protein
VRVVNFFAGEGTWARPWEDRGHQVWKTDIELFNGIDHLSDIMDLRLSEIPEADVVLGSPDCTAFSVASLGTHWGGGHRGYVPKTAKAHNRMGLVHQTVAFIETMVARDGLQIGVLENPRGMLRKLSILQAYDRETVAYCRYGDTRMKPTDLWGVPGFPLGWTPREMCQNGNPDHEAAPRGAKTGTQGLAKQARSHMPYALSEELCRAAERHLGDDGDFRCRVVSPEGFAFYRAQVPEKYAHFITPYPVETIRDAGVPYLVTGEGGAAGFLLKHDGEIANLFAVGEGTHGWGAWVLDKAIRLGGNHVAYFDTPFLEELYRGRGFVEDLRFRFDLDLIHQDFPDFDPDVSGTPDYVIARR